jgi:nucleotide-binding universal stress UspA family protein
MFKRIVVATDLVSMADAPVISAIRIARRHGAELYLLHVMESASTENRRLVRHFETGAEMNADADYEQAIRQTLEESFPYDLSAVPHAV